MRRTEQLQGLRLMKFEDVYGRCYRGDLSQAEASEILGMSERTFRRWRERYEAKGAAGLYDRRLGRVSARRAPVEGERRLRHETPKDEKHKRADRRDDDDRHGRVLDEQARHLRPHPDGGGAGQAGRTSFNIIHADTRRLPHRARQGPKQPMRKHWRPSVYTQPAARPASPVGSR